MRICIPVEKDEGLASRVYGHFGSAPFFAVFDTATERLEVVPNMDHHHVHGQCNAVAALSERTVDLLVTGGIGARAAERLRSMGIRICLAEGEGTVANVIQSWRAGALREMEPHQACSTHTCT